eukprot:1147631-Pelagomonas_calceolata.AAC.4
MASPLDYNTRYLHYLISDPRYILIGAQHNSLSSKYSGVSIYHPIYDDKAMTQVLRHAIYSPILKQRLGPPSYFCQQANPTWLQDLAKDIPEAKWFVKNGRNDPFQNARHAVMPGIGKCEKLPLDKKQIAEEELDWLQLLLHSLTNTHSCHRQPQLTSPTQKPNTVPREAQTSSGNGYGDRIAKYHASLKNNNPTNTCIPNAGPGGNPFYSIAWLA